VSVRASSDVWEFSRASGTDLLVLLAIADYASDTGVAWPAQTTIAKKARCSDRTVRRCIDNLVAAGELVIVEEGNGRGKSARYRVTVTRSECPPSDGEERWTPAQERRTSAQERWTPEVEKVDTAMSTEPCEPCEPSAEPRDARETVPSPHLTITAAVAACPSTDLDAQVRIVSDAVGGLWASQVAVVRNALMDDRDGVARLAEHAVAVAEHPARFLAAAVRAGKHVGFSEQTAAPSKRDASRAEAEERVARIYRMAGWAV
jgi:hypothetical protein